MKQFLIALILLVAIAFAPAQTIRGVQMLTTSNGTAVGFTGIVITTTNGGVSWTSQNSGTTNNLHSVYFMDSDTGVVVGGDEFSTAKIIRSNDKGVTWNAKTSNVTSSLQGVAFASATTGVAVGNNGVITRSTDNGRTWAAVTSGTTNHLIGVSFGSSTVGWAVGYLGTILKTTDGGATWSAQSSGNGNDLIGVYASSATVVYAVGASGTILKTTNAGTSWSALSSGVPYDLYGVSFSSTTTGTVVGYAGRILRTTDGSAWTQQSSGTAQTLTSVSMASTSVGVVTGGSLTVLRTADGGSTWLIPGTASSTTPPATPTLSSPTDATVGVSTSPTLVWNPSKGASTYHLQVSTDALFSTLIFEDSTLTGTSQALSGLSNSTLYLWRVSAKNDSGTSSYSAPFTFTTAQAGPVFSLSPSSLDFGNVKTRSSKSLLFTITNTGGVSLVVSSITSSSSTFTVSSSSATIAPGSNQGILIKFSPRATQAYTGTITFTHNATGSPSTATVTGMGTKK